MRIFSETLFLAELKEAGFDLQIQKHTDYFDTRTTFYFGVNKLEDLIQVKKPA